MKHSLIPKNKTKGFRFGQLIYNACKKKGIADEYINDYLRFVENEELEKIINNYLKTWKQ